MVAFAAQLIFSFGFAAFLGLFLLWFRQPPERRAHSPYGAPFLYCAAWFGCNLLTEDFALLLAAACGFPAVLLHLFRLRGVAWAGAAGAATAALAVATRTWAIPVQAPAAVFSVVLAAALYLAARRGEVRHSSGYFLLGCILLVPLALYAGAPWLRLFVRSLPLSLLLLDSFVRRRFLFFDLFVKWGLAFLLALSLLSLWFAIVPEQATPLTKALLMAPLLWLVPRGSRLLARYVDRRYLKRPFTPVLAERRFAEALRSAGGEAEVRQVAGRELSLIFGARVDLIDSGAGGEFEARCPLPLASEPGYDLVVGRDPAARPFFSQDFQLLDTLARVLAFVLDNRRLESHGQRLQREAAESELKALRAQVNPHFLFNALNTVAGLIPRRPELAETVVEKLAEVFRYTLRGAESEWVTLGEELEAARALLEVEQARHGPRLQIAVSVPVELSPSPIPAMTLLTLVENAIKHGVARTPGGCALRIGAERDHETLTISVRNGGPAPAPDAQSGYGLKNVRERLARHYGDRAKLELTRDERAGETAARIEVPV